MPVLKHYQGIGHLRGPRRGPGEARILINAKCQRPGVCNAAEVVWRTLMSLRYSFPCAAQAPAREQGGDARAAPDRAPVADVVPATDKDYATKIST